MTETALDRELQRRVFVMSKLRHSDMGEQATNKLMEQLSDDPDLLDSEIDMIDDGSEPFEIREFNQRGTVVLQTRIGALDMSDVMAARLRTLYVTHHPPQFISPAYLNSFSRAAFLLLHRYSYVDPGYKRQGFLGPHYFEAISRAFKMPIDLEGFASAINTTVPNYCSLFPDVEAPFGSLGSFFDLKDLGDMQLIQVSPPRLGMVTRQAMEHSIKLLKSSYQGIGRWIVTLTPAAWQDVTKLIDDSGLCVWHNNTKRGDMIEYYDVIRNQPTRYPMPRVSVLSNRESDDPVMKKASAGLHAAFTAQSR